MPKYIRIRNVFNDDQIISRISLEKLGLSTKRDNPDTIGKFGSGIKFAPIAALRNGWEWWFMGNDNRGLYNMQYVVRDEDGIDCIWYDYGDELKPSSFTVGAGELSWTDPFQIIREPIANAMDAANEIGGFWDIEVVDSVGCAVANEFNIYISAAPQLMDIVNNIGKYFSTNRERLYSSASGRNEVLAKIDDNLRIYSHDVLVYVSDDKKSLFDYSLNAIALNEERTIKSEWEMCMRIANSLASLPENLVKKVINAFTSANDYFEFHENILTYIPGNESGWSSDWNSIFKQIHGKNAIIVDPSTGDNVFNALKMRSLKPVVAASDNIFKFACKANVDNYLAALGEDHQYDISNDLSQYPNLTEALSIARLAEPDLNQYADNIGVVFGDAADCVKGMVVGLNTDKARILISDEHLQNASVSDLVATLIHEYDHISTGIGDGYGDGPAFRDLADSRIGRMIVKNYKSSPFTIVNGMLGFMIADANLIGNDIDGEVEYSSVFDSLIVKIGDYKILVQAEDANDFSSSEKLEAAFQGEGFVGYHGLGYVKSFQIV